MKVFKMLPVLEIHEVEQDCELWWECINIAEIPDYIVRENQLFFVHETNETDNLFGKDIEQLMFQQFPMATELSVYFVKPKAGRPHHYYYVTHLIIEKSGL